MIALAIGDDTEAQQGRKGPQFGKKGDFPRGISAEQIVERLLAFDKNNDGKITADELPERMQHLIALGDINKDGALDKEEIQKLATTLEAFAGLAGNGGPGGPPPGVLAKDGPKGGPPKGGPFRGAANDVQRTLDDLNVSGPVRDKADRALRAHQDKIRRFEELARAELIMQMKDVLNEEDYRVFKSALDRPAGPPGGRGPRPLDLNTRIEQVQKDLEDMRRKVQK
jgi:hypothetical protein